MKDRYRNFKNLLMNMLVHLEIDNKCILKKTGHTFELDQLFSKMDYFIELNDSESFIFRGDFTYLMKNVRHLIKNSDFSFISLTHDKHLYISQLIDQILNAVNMQEMVRFWSMKISKEFIEIFEEYNISNILNFNKEEFIFVELEIDSWISQIKNLLCCKRNVDKRCLLEEKVFWYQFNENIRILESFFNSNQFKFMYRITIEYNLLIAKSTFEALQNLSKYKKLSDSFNEYYKKLELELLYQSNNIKAYKATYDKIIDIIVQTFDRQQTEIKNSLRSNINGLLNQTIKILGISDLKIDYSHIRSVITCSYRLFHSLFKPDHDKFSLENDLFRDLLSKLSDFNKYCTEYEHCLHSFRIVNIFKKIIESEHLNVLEEKTKEYADYIAKNYKNSTTSLLFNDFDEVNIICINLLALLFKAIWSNNSVVINLTNVLTKNDNLGIGFNSKLMGLQHTSSLNASSMSENTEFNNNFRCLIIFEHFLEFELFRNETTIERTSLLDHYYRCLVVFSNNLNYDEVNLSNELGLYLGFIHNFNIMLDVIFNSNENLVMIDTLREKIKMIEETLHLRLNLQFEKSYNNFIRKKITETVLMTIRENCSDIIESLNLVDLNDVYAEVDYYTTLAEILENSPKCKFGKLFIKSVQESHFYILLMEELHHYFEFRTDYCKYSKSLKQFKDILSKCAIRVELFKEEIENVFKEIRKIYNLKIKYLLLSKNGLEKTVARLTNKYTEFIILTTRLNLHKNFKGKFTFNAEEHCVGTGHPNTFFFRTCIEASYDILVYNYFQSVIDRLMNGQIYKEITIDKENCPNLIVGLELFEEIFPQQLEIFFFDRLIDFVQIGPHLTKKIEEIIEIVIIEYTKAQKELDFLYNHVEVNTEIEKIDIYKRKVEILDKVNKNEYLLYKFISNLNTIGYQNMIDNLIQTLDKKRNLMVRSLMKKSKNWLADTLSHYSLSNITESPLICGKFLLFYVEIFKRSYKKIKKTVIKEINNESFIEIDELSLKFKSVFKNIKTNRNSILSNTNKEVVEVHGKLEKYQENNLCAEENLEDIENHINSLDQVLMLFNRPIIDRSLLVTLKKSFKDKKLISSIQRDWNVYKKTKINNLDTDKLNSFIETLETLYIQQHEDLNYILMKKDMIEAIPMLFRDYVTIGFFDTEIHLEDYLIDYSYDQIMKILHDSQMSYKSAKAIKKLRMSISNIYYNFDEIILNFEDIENELFAILAECNALETYIKLDKYVPEVKELTETVYRMIKLNTRIREVQDINIDLKRIISGDVFKSIKSKFEKLNQEVTQLIASTEEKENFENSKYPLRNLLEKEKTIEGLKSNAIELQLHVKSTIVSYRKSIHRFYFVSDEDILNLLCGRLTYSEILLQMYNIDKIITLNNIVNSFRSKDEVVNLSQPIDMSLNVDDFFNKFAESLNETFTLYLKQNICHKKSYSSKNPEIVESVKKYCGKIFTKSLNDKISVIDDFLNELYYFNNFSFLKSTKLNFLRKIDDKWNGDVVRLYPKPGILNDRLIVNDISMNNVFMEYYPPSDIVFTNLTSSIFSMITLGLSKTAGIILFGKSGTGKTETVKYYCRTILRPVYVFCCSEECDISTLENIITGCIKMGAYLCLDEFNRLKKNTMSSVTELIFKNKEDVKFFLTMNFGYSGRNELPKSLRSIFTEIRVDNPDIEDIVEIFFEDYSTKIMRFLPELEKNCEKLEHYNFGLRAIKTIIGTKIDTEVFNRLFECEILTQHYVLYVLYMFYYANLSKIDKTILHKIFHEIFEVKITNTILCQDTFIFGLSASKGLLVYGKEKSGKSTLIRDLAIQNNISIEYYNPPNTTNFFGSYDEVTGEWIDGEFVTSLKKNKDREVWYVFDCILSSNWIENFNSVLDENKSLCLKSGEIIKIGSKNKFIFESDNLDEITPATLTRIFTIYMEDSKKETIIAEKVLRSEVLLNNKVIVLTGHGKFDIVSNLVSERLVTVDANDKSSNNFFNLFTKDDLIVHNNEKIFVGDIVLYIDSFDKANQKLQEFVREYAQYGKIGDISPSKLTVICGYDNEINKRLKHKTIVIECKNEEIISKITRLLTENAEYFCLFEYLRISKQLEKFTDTLVHMYEVEYIKYYDIFKQCKVLSSVLSTKPDELFINIFYYVSCMFSSRETMDVFIKIWDKHPQITSYSLEVGFTHDTNHCVMNLISLILSIKHTLVIIGPRLSSKRFLIESCAEKMYSELQIYNFYDEFKFDPSGVYLIDNLDCIPKILLRKSIVLYMDAPLFIGLDYDSFYSSLSENNSFRLYGLYEDSVIKKSSCKCCFLNIPEANRIYSTKQSINKEYFKNEMIIRNSEYTVVDINDLFRFEILKKNIFIMFDSVYKYRDFVETACKLYNQSVKNFNKRREHIQEGYKRISKFKEQASDLLTESVRKKYQLEQLQSQVKIKMNKMVEIQILMKVEKERIFQNQNELDAVFKDSLEKKNIIDIKMKDIIPLLEESKSKISNISKKHLAEIKTMVKPPEIIKFVIELVYVMLEDNPDINVTWSSLIQYIRKDDFMSKVINFKGIENMSNLERILQGRTMETKKAYNASHACGILYEWIVANFEYKKVYLEVKPLLDETEEVKKKIESLEKQITEEETKYKHLEDEINASKREYTNLKESLENIRKETNEIENKQVKINSILNMIHNETDRWHIKEPEDILKFMRNNPEWCFIENKIIFIAKNQKIEKEIKELNLKNRSFLKTSTRHKNFLQVLRNVQDYNSDVLIYDVDEFSVPVYKLLKYQMTNKTFSIILISNHDINYYPECTYNYEVHGRLFMDKSIDLAKHEQDFLNAILQYNDLDEINKCKMILDEKREEYIALQSIRNHYIYLNKIYSQLDLKYRQSYGFGLSFDLFKKHLEDTGFINSRSENDENINNEISKTITKYFNLGLPDNKNPINIKEEYDKCNDDITIISTSGDIIYEIEMNIKITDTISAGSTKNNTKITNLLNSEDVDNCTYLIKNVNLLDNNAILKADKKTRFIFVSEEIINHNLIYNTRILYNPREIEIEKIKEKYLRIFRENEEIVEYHCKMLKTKDVNFNDLLLMITSKGLCSDKYLKYLIYDTKYNENSYSNINID